MLRQFLCFISMINMFFIFGLSMEAVQDFQLVDRAVDKITKLAGPLNSSSGIALQNIENIYCLLFLLTLLGIFLLFLTNLCLFLATRNKAAVLNKWTRVRLLAGMAGFIIQWIAIFPDSQSEQWRTDMRNIIAAGTNSTWSHRINYDFITIYTIYTSAVLGASFYYVRNLPFEVEAKKGKISSEKCDLCLA